MILHPDTLVVLDESVWKKIARGIKLRGYPVQTVPERLQQGVKDPALLADLSLETQSLVLVTKDRAMTVDHDSELRRAGIALAVLDLGELENTPAEPYRQADIVHRHLHRMAGQEAGTRWRYALRSRLQPKSV